MEIGSKNVEFFKKEGAKYIEQFYWENDNEEYDLSVSEMDYLLMLLRLEDPDAEINALYTAFLLGVSMGMRKAKNIPVKDPYRKKIR